MMSWTLLILGYVISALLAYGLTLHYFQTQFRGIAWHDRYLDVAFAVFWSLSGPVFLVVVLMMIKMDRAPYGWLWRPLPHDVVNCLTCRCAPMRRTRLC